jgi:hypothetical protein
VTMLVENPLAIIVVGGVLATFAAIVFLARRTAGSLAALVAVIAATLLLVVVERVLVSDREQIESSLASVLGEIEANNVNGVLDWIDPAAGNMRSEVQALMPLVKVDKARSMGTVDVDINGGANPPTAHCSFRAFLDGVHGSSGMRVAYFNQRVELEWIKRGDRWLIDGYMAYYNDEPIDAISSARGNRAVPSGGSGPTRIAPRAAR